MYFGTSKASKLSTLAGQRRQAAVFFCCLFLCFFWRLSFFVVFFCLLGGAAACRCENSRASVAICLGSICTFVLVKQVNCVQAAAEIAELQSKLQLASAGEKVLSLLAVLVQKYKY